MLKIAFFPPLRKNNNNNKMIIISEKKLQSGNQLVVSIINYPNVCVWVGLFVTELLPNEGSNLNK